MHIQKAVLKDANLYIGKESASSNTNTAAVLLDKPGSKVRGWLVSSN